MGSERDDLLEHLERYRAVTLQHLDLFADAELGWRPRPDAFSVGQQFVHILHNEDFYIRGLFENDWNMARLRFPPVLPAGAALKEQFAEYLRGLGRVPPYFAMMVPDGKRPDIEARAVLDAV